MHRNTLKEQRRTFGFNLGRTHTDATECRPACSVLSHVPRNYRSVRFNPSRVPPALWSHLAPIKSHYAAVAFCSAPRFPLSAIVVHLTDEDGRGPIYSRCPYNRNHCRRIIGQAAKCPIKCANFTHMWAFKRLLHLGTIFIQMSAYDSKRYKNSNKSS